MLGINYPIPHPFRYILFFLITILKLLKYKPDAIICQVPPIFTAFTAYIYMVLYCKGKILVDVHSDELIGFKWKFLKPLRRYLFGRASIVILHNKENYERIKNWNENFVILNDKIPNPPEVIPKKLCDNCREVVFISSFASSEPYHEEIEVAKLMEGEKDWIFVFTGDPTKIKNFILPKNIILTGYVPYKEYWDILKGADVIVSIDRRPQVITSGVWEGISLEKPVVTNNTYLLRELFEDAFIYTSLSPPEIIKSIKRAYKKSKILEINEKRKKQELSINWEKSFAQIKKTLSIS